MGKFNTWHLRTLKLRAVDYSQVWLGSKLVRAWWLVAGWYFGKCGDGCGERRARELMKLYFPVSGYRTLIRVFHNYHDCSSWKIENTLIRFIHQDLLGYYHWAVKNSKLDGCGYVRRTDICDPGLFVFNFELDSRCWLLFLVWMFALQKKEKPI